MMDENKIVTLIASVRRGQQAVLFKEYSQEVFGQIKLEVLRLLVETDIPEHEARGLLKGIKMIDDIINADINTAKIAERKISD